MNYAHLEILGINIPIGISEYYDDGFVESILEHELKLNKKYGIYGISKCDENIKTSEICVGELLVYGAPGKNNYFPHLKSYYHIFYVNQQIEIANTLMRAHEETHALQTFEKLDILAEKLLEEQRVKINFKEIDDKEVIANLGSLYAIHVRESSQVKIGCFYERYSTEDSRTTAIKIYEKSKLIRK